MDLNKQRLKSRLNVKFEPLKNAAGSLKRLKLPERVSKDFSKQKEKQTSILLTDRNRSISHVRLPSLERKSVISRKLEDRTQQVSIYQEMKQQRIKSIKILPTIKAESREPINDTLTFLIKNQILTVPKIVAMLQKAKSDEFMYMRVKGIYEYEVCSEQEKGSSYITVSKNGMVSQGELIPLEKLIYEYDLYSKLRKVPFFRYYFLIKFMNKWNRGSKVAKFIETKYRIKRLLFLENEKIINWKIELKNILLIGDRGGSLHSGWVNRVSEEIEKNKETVEIKLLSFAIELLQKFQLPISANFQLINKVLNNLLALNLSFQKKLRIEKQLQIIYKIGRMLQLHQQQSIAFYLLNHIQQLSELFIDSNQAYIAKVLYPLEELDLKQPSYITEKDKILLNSTPKQGINFKMIINDNDEIKIEPSMTTVFLRLKQDVKEFIAKIDKFDFKIVRVSKFDFVHKNVVKADEIVQIGTSKGKGQMTLKDYIFSIDQYYDRMNDLKQCSDALQDTFERKCALLIPFFNIYQKYKEKHMKKIYEDYNYQQINQQCNEIQEKIQFCKTKIHDGEYFILGYLSQLQIKEQIVTFLLQYKDIVMAIIPTKIRMQRQQFYDSILNHLRVFRDVITTPKDYIKVHLEYEELQEKMLLYSEDLSEIQRLQEIYLRIKKVQLGSLAQEKSLMNELKIKVRNFKDTKENSYLLYRKELQTMKKDLISKLSSISASEQFYQTTDTPDLIYSKCHRHFLQLKQINKDLVELNELQSFFDLKQTVVGMLNSLLLKFQSLEEVWLIYKQFQYEKQQLSSRKILKIESNNLIKKYEVFLRKIEKWSKDPDYYKIGHYLLQAMPPFLSSLYLIEDLHNEILREQDFNEITQLFEKEFRLNIPVRQLTFSSIMTNKIYEIRQQILEINFKSHKEQQIERLLRQFQQWWKSIRLEGDYLDQYPLIIIFQDNDQLRQQIQQYTTTLLNIINHKYGTFARKECNFHLRNINSLAEMLSLAITHQEKFLSLFPILTSKYAEKQLPAEAKKFLSIIEKSMKNVKWLIKPTENLNENTRVMLNNHIKQFDAISKTIAHFLEKKRVKFQRFYFLQDDELLQVLVGIGAQNTIFRMFEGVKGWLINGEGIKEGVQGVGGQFLRLRGWAYKQQEPEIIFKSLEQAIRTNLNSIVRQTLHGYENQLKQLINLYENIPWMCIYTVELILFTKQIEINCFQNSIDLSVQSSLIQQNIVSRVSDPLKNSNYITLQLFLLHYTEELRKEAVNTIFDFKWHSFLRYYYEKQSVVMKALGAEHNWGGQYQGLWNLMINTSDIRRAHTSILSNLKYGDGVLLQGPSGTGKTESLKELGRCMAKYCVIFNCSSEVNIRTLHKLLSGLCYTGSWLCLDEINRLTAEIMSVVANQINTIKNAVVQNREVFNFMGRDMRLRHGVGIFSTMNPIYLKRAKLTQNLKAYFRIISVNVPDYQKILQVLLYSLGISSSSQYSGKISKLFKNLSIQLSERPQYDFGLRAMKFFIYNLSTIRKTLKNQEDSIIEGLYKTFYSRLDQEDRQVFLKVIADTFSKKREQKESNYKVAMMKEAPQTGIIVLGPTSTKTTIIQQYISLFEPQSVQTEVFNPNSIQLKYFLGQSLLGRWQQGIVERVARASFQNTNMNYILILDSKLKSETIQNFNTLLDDSKLLSLSNGTRLKIHNNFKLVMQTPDLQMTSPATITRCNVVYVSQRDVEKKDVIVKMVPILSSKELQDKVSNILSSFKVNTILKILQLARLLFFRKIVQGDLFNESESIGYEKSLIFSIQLLGKGDKIREYLTKDNSISHKKNPFNFWLNFSKYKQGQYCQFDHGKQPLRHLGDLYIPTIRNMFYKYINYRAIDKQEHLLWKGEKMSGKTTGILMSLQEIFKSQQESKDIFKMTINPKYASRRLIQAIEEKAGLKEQPDQAQNILLVFIDDINLANEEMNEFLRYTLEYRKMFSLKNKATYSLPNHAIIADASNQPQKQFTTRFCRHFAQLSLPASDQDTIKHIYTSLIKNILIRTKTGSQFKATYELQLEKIVNFMIEYLRFNNQAYKSAREDNTLVQFNLQYLSYCHLIPILKNLSVLNEINCKDVADLIAFLLSQFRTQQVQHQKTGKQIDFIKLSYNEVFKHKFQGQYAKTLKSVTSNPEDCLQYTMFQKNFVEKIDNWGELKKNILQKMEEGYYASEFILEEMVKVLRVLQWSGGHYFMVGDSGVGKRTLLKMAALLARKQLIDTLPVDQRKIGEWYFNLIKTSFEKRKDQVVLIEVKREPMIEKVLMFLEQITSNYPIQSLLINEYCDYAYNNAEYYDEIEYDKFSMPYIQVIEDFLSISKKKIQFLFYSIPQQLPQFVRCHHYLHKETTYRFISEFPTESILQISNKILEQSNLQLDKQKINAILLKIYSELIHLMKNNNENNMYHFRYNPFSHFNFIKRFIQNYKAIIEKTKRNQDVLNRSILKVHQISEVLEKLKAELKAMEPQAKEKTEKLLSVVPVLQAKKKVNQEVKAYVLSQKREIQAKNSEIEQLMREVELKIKRAEPLLQEANDSMLTLKRGQLSELRNNPNPHPLLKFTLENMVILLGQSDSLDNIKKILSDPNLLSRLKNITPSQADLLKVQKRINDNPQWTFQNVSKISYGIRYMVRWTTSMIKFNLMKRELDGERTKVEQFKRELHRLEEQLAQKQNELNAKQFQIRLIEDEYKFNKDQLIHLQELITLNNKKYQNAELIKTLLQEQIFNWHNKLQMFNNLRKNLAASSILVTLFLEIFVTLHSEEQQKLHDNTLELFARIGIPYDPFFKVLDYIRDEILKNQDYSQPAATKEEISQEAISLTNLSIEDSQDPKLVQLLYHIGNRPILLDPDNQALNWLQKQVNLQSKENKVSPTKVIIVKESFTGAVKNVELAMRQGHILVILIEDELDAFTREVLAAKITETSGNRLIDYNKNKYPISPRFKLLLCNKSRNPKLENKLYISHPVLNFEITKVTLKKMLLREMMMLQNRSIYSLRSQLQIQTKANLRNISTLQQQIIESLINSKKTLIDDKQFIYLLQKNQASRNRLRESQLQWIGKTSATKKILDAYQQISEDTSTIFMSLRAVAKINPLLAWNTEIFVQYFKQAAIASISSPLIPEVDEEQYIEASSPRKGNYDFDSYNVGVGNSRPTSALSLLSGITDSQREAPLTEERKDDFEEQHPALEHNFDNLIGMRESLVDEKQKGTMNAQRESRLKYNLIEYLKPAFSEQERIVWGVILCLSKYDFKQIKILLDVKSKRKNLRQYQQMGELTDRIKNYLSRNIQKSDADIAKLLSSSNPFKLLADELSQIDILLLSKLLLPNMFSTICQTLIKNKGYSQLLKYSETTTSNWFQRSDNVHPILLVMGEDPLYRLSDYLARKRYKNVILVAMGEGQNKLAEVVLQKESRKENLVIIHNLHISSNFMMFLSKMLQQFQIRPPHKNFRLVLISAQFDELNEEITSYCHKYLIEQPMGIRNQMRYLRQQSTINFTHPSHRQLAFVLTYLHSITNNLSKYKPYGWNLKYEFTTADYLSSLQKLKQVGESRLQLSRYECNIDPEEQRKKVNVLQIDFKALQFMIGQIGYVGKLADDIDRAKMNILIKQFINPGIYKQQGEHQALKLLNLSRSQSNDERLIDQIPEHDPTIFGLHPNVRPLSQNQQIILSRLSKVYREKNKYEQEQVKYNEKSIEPIKHKFEYINNQVTKFNQMLEKVKLSPNLELRKMLRNRELLALITTQTRIFNLRAFSNPREFFVSMKKEVAHRTNVTFESVELQWSLLPKENASGIYGICGLRLEGASVNNNRTSLDDGLQERDITLYVMAVVRKKERQGKRVVSIPIYLQQQRQGQINSYGDNTNLLAKAYLQANHRQQFWILRSTAFIVT